jgi:hypothetical protein
MRLGTRAGAGRDVTAQQTLLNRTPALPKKGNSRPGPYRRWEGAIDEPDAAAPGTAAAGSVMVAG